MRVVDPFQPVEPDVHLLTSIDLLPSQYVTDAMRDGLQFVSGFECTLPNGWPKCRTDLDDGSITKNTADLGPDVGFEPFMAYFAMECEDGTLHAATESRWAQHARVAFDAIKHQIVAEQLWFNGVQETRTDSNGVLINQSLKSSAVVLGSTVAVADPISVIARLVAARRELSGSGRVLIHGPLVLVPYLVSRNVIRKVGGRYEGPGFIYVTDEGYPDDVGGVNFAGTTVTAGPYVNPANHGAGFYADVAGEVWLYASGATEYAWGPYVGKTMLGAPLDNDGRYSTYTSWDGRTNRTFINVEQLAFVRFDPCGVLAAKAYIPTVTNGE